MTAPMAAIVAVALEASGRAERAGRLDEARAIVEDTRARLGDRAGPGARVAAAVLAVVSSRLTLAIAGPEAALALAELARAAPDDAWSVRAAAELALAAAHLRIHTAPALVLAREALQRAGAGPATKESGAPEASVVVAAGGEVFTVPDARDGIDDHTAAVVATSGDAARFLVRGSLASYALELRGLAAARDGDIRTALDAFDGAYQLADGDPARRARALLAWGLQLRNWGLLDEALRRIERSLELRLELEDLHGAAICQGVIAFVHQRRGDHVRERDALAADLRLCERIGSDADVPGLRARLAGALVGLGKYAAGFAEAEAAIAGEDARRPGAPGRIHGFAWREQARVRLAEHRLDDADALLARAIATFTTLGDPYAAALCELTSAQVALARVEDALDDAGRAAAVAALIAARDRAAPVFARLGAIVEAAELTLVVAEARGVAGDRAARDAAAAAILARVIPALVGAGLGDAPLAIRARQLAELLSPGAVRADLVARAARLPGLAASVLDDGDPA